MVPSDGPRGQVALVTGGNSGIGRETALELVKQGWHVVLGCRSPEQAESAAASIRASAPAAGLGSVEVGPRLDLADPESIASFVTSFQESHPVINVLVNNAGALTVPNTVNAGGVVNLAQINYLGPFHLTRLMLGQLRSCRARVVNVSSMTHRMAALPDPEAFLTVPQSGDCIEGGKGIYPKTKLANVLFSFELQRRCPELQCCAVDPGFVMTRIWKGHPMERFPLRQITSLIFSQSDQGCKAVVHAATCALDANSAAPRPASAATPQSADLSAQPLTTKGSDGPIHGSATAGSITDAAASLSGRAVAGGAQGAEGGAAQPPLLFFARGAFTWNTVTGSACGSVSQQAALTGAIAADQLVRSLTLGAFGGTTHAVPAAPAAYNEASAAKLWAVSSRLCGLPVDV